MERYTDPNRCTSRFNGHQCEGVLGHDGRHSVPLSARSSLLWDDKNPAPLTADQVIAALKRWGHEHGFSDLTHDQALLLQSLIDQLPHPAKADIAKEFAEAMIASQKAAVGRPPSWGWSDPEALEDVRAGLKRFIQILRARGVTVPELAELEAR